MNDKFEKEKFKYVPGNSPAHLFNRVYTPKELIGRKKSLSIHDDGHIICCDEQFLKLEGNKYLRVESRNEVGSIPLGAELTPFEVLSELRFNKNYRYAIQHVEFEHMNKEVPYIRVRTNYFKRITKKNNWGIKLEKLVPWTERAIKTDHSSKGILRQINLYDDFTMEPNNKNYQRFVDGNFNRYQPFPHEPAADPTTKDDFPVTATFMQHVFGDQVDLGYKYLKVLYEKPKQILPVLVLVSKERETGKTSFLNWMSILFGNNYGLVPPADMASQFNSQYAYKNIVAVDEAVIDKKSAVEKIKSLATTKSIQVNEKMIAQYSVPFYGKIIIATNKERDFMRVDEEEIRFWVRKLDTIPATDKIQDFEEQLIAETPAFLRYLEDMEDIEYGKSRMIFTKKQLSNDLLDEVKKESRSWLHKDIEIYVENWFDENPEHDELYARIMDIKRRWFENNNRANPNYIQKVLNEELKMGSCENARYQFLGHGRRKMGRPYKFTRNRAKNETANAEKAPF